MTPAQEIMAVIKEIGWSQRKIARFLDITPKTVTRWNNQAKQDSGEVEVGECATPHPHTLRLLKAVVVGTEGTWANRVVELESKIDTITRVLQGGEG